MSPTISLTDQASSETIFNPKNYIVLDQDQFFSFNDIQTKINNGEVVAFIENSSSRITICYLLGFASDMIGSYPYQAVFEFQGKSVFFGATDPDNPMVYINGEDSGDEGAR